MGENEFASIDEMAATVETDASAVGVAELVRALLQEESSISVGDLQAVGTPLVAHPGRALRFTVGNYEGVEFDVIVQARP